MADRDVLRWLLRPLAEPAFIRLYCEHSALSWRHFEDAFWSLGADLEHPEDARERAWRTLVDWLPSQRCEPAEWFATVLQRLRDNHEWQDHLADLARFWSLPALFDSRDSTDGEEPGAPDNRIEYYEIHCHLRGAVPYLFLWGKWLDNARWRALLRTLECRAGPWRRTWAELVEQAKESRETLLRISGNHADAPDGDMESEIRNRVARIEAGELPGERRRHAVLYLSICAGLRRELVHQRRQSGLAAFHESYSRYSRLQKRPGARAADRIHAIVPAILRRFACHGAACVELRPTLDSRRSDMQRKLTAIVESYLDYLAAEPADSNHPPPLMALVPSLYKQEALGEHFDPGDPGMWRRQSEIWCEQIRTLLAIIEEVPALRWFLVGLDAAGRERGCPPRVLAPAVALVKRYNARHGLSSADPGRAMQLDALRQLAMGSPGDRGQRAFAALDRRHWLPRVRLGITVHAGEDFVDPMTGLRHVWESVADLGLRPGDRMGHALAAGLSRDDAFELLRRRARERGEVEHLGGRRFRLCKPRGVHLLDLAWLAQMSAGRERHLWHARLSEAATGTFGVPVDAERLAGALRAPSGRFTPLVPAIRFVGPDQVDSRDRTWHTVDDLWFETFDRLRRRVVDELRRRSIVVESCPTSNMAVAGVSKPPLRRFLAERVPCAIATDDPGLFGVWPRDELARIDDAWQHDQMLARAASASFVRAS